MSDLMAMELAGVVFVLALVIAVGVLWTRRAK